MGYLLTHRQPPSKGVRVLYHICFSPRRNYLGAHSDTLSIIGPDAIVVGLSLGAKRVFMVQKKLPWGSKAAAGSGSEGTKKVIFFALQGSCCCGVCQASPFIASSQLNTVLPYLFRSMLSLMCLSTFIFYRLSIMYARSICRLPSPNSASEVFVLAGAPHACIGRSPQLIECTTNWTLAVCFPSRVCCCGPGGSCWTCLTTPLSLCGRVAKSGTSMRYRT